MTVDEIARLKWTTPQQLLELYDAGAIPPLARLPLLGEVDTSPFIAGWSHLLAAYPKSGKTELLARLVCEWQIENTIYISEESALMWAERWVSLRAADYTPPAMNVFHALGCSKEEIGEASIFFHNSLVIIDTLRLLGIEDENDNALVGRLLTPFVAAARDVGNILVMAHHSNKAALWKGSGHGESIAGAHAFLAIVDVAIMMGFGSTLNRRTLCSIGRIDTSHEFAYDMVDGRMFLVDEHTNADGKAMAGAGEILDILSEDEGWLVTARIHELFTTKISKSSLARTLKWHAEEGRVSRYPKMGQQATGKHVQWKFISPMRGAED